MPTALISLAFAFLLSATSVFAQEAATLPKGQILQSVRAYAEAIGCNFEMDAKNIVAFDVDGDGSPEVIALFTVDRGCKGGSGTTANDLAVLTAGGPRVDQFFVDPKLSHFFGLPRFIDRIYVKKGQLWFDGKKAAEGDLHNFPSLRVSSPLKLVTTDVPLPNGTGRSVRHYYWRSVIDF